MECNKDENQATESGKSRRMRGRKTGRNPKVGCALKMQLRCTKMGNRGLNNLEKRGG